MKATDERRLKGGNFVAFKVNISSNAKHIQVLKEAMENMTNGLPIFVTEFNTLDSIDNERLYKEIDSLEELDSRFTMVVVNKSDKANLPVDGFTQADEDKILSMAIPKNLYSGGIYFVSSVIGLGAKTKGEFDNEFYEEIFEDTMPRFSNPEHKRYKQLYRYNIMPEQLKKEAIEESEECDDLLLAMKFQKINAERLEKDRFEIKLFSVFAIDPLNINRMKLARTYNSEINRSKEGNYRNIFTSHIDSYVSWLENLKELLLDLSLDLCNRVQEEIQTFNRKERRFTRDND